MNKYIVSDMPSMSRIYKDSSKSCCFTLNRLVSELGIDLYQADLETNLTRS